MCGDFDEDERIDEELFERYALRLEQYGVLVEAGGADAPQQLDSEERRAGYMKELFRAGLTRSARDSASLPQGDRMDGVAGQALVFARLAGFLTAQLPPDSDLFRAASAALLDGYNEAAGLD